MNDKLAHFLLSLYIAVPACLIIGKIKTIHKSWYPLAYLLCLGLANEIAGYFIFFKSNAIPNNIYYVTEFVLYCILFRNWRHILTDKKLFYLLVIGVILFWLTDEIMFMKITTFDSVFLFVYPSILVLLAVNELNFIVANEHNNIMKNPAFIFCCAIIISYSYQALHEIFYHYAPRSEMRRDIFSIQAYINVLFNILLTLVVLCLPKKRIITLR